MLIRTVLLCFSLLLALLVKEEPQQQFVLRGFAQGTEYSIRYFAVKLKVSEGEIDSLLSLVDSSMSLYKSYSQINTFNHSTKGLMIDRHFKAVMERSFEISKDTRGKFDVTVAPLVRAWGFGPDGLQQFPDSAAVKGLLENVGMEHLQLTGMQLNKLKPEVTVDLNGIAQGYTVDLLADFLARKGISSFVVEIGGELRVRGVKPDGNMFRIGIEGPLENDASGVKIKHVIGFTNAALTTSGNYQKYLQFGGRKISHLIDPKTGFPLDTEMISVTVFAKDAITADGYDNALMAMTVPEALAFVKARKDMEAYMIYQRKGQAIKDTMTVGFKKMLVN
ncbi:FAD:protein FMN transferase [Pedobacter sp. MR2016-24]|uniref:FAD:protein FMN transferase n=1 Tax=Pedobacter sp. MR2016-24 TaxID=2994466 RepID=UPI0022453679|nr:FAD:protein FMN transferase [Pedobacter sp. MR2016-24]